MLALTDGAAAVVMTARDRASTGEVSIATTAMVSHRSGSSVVRRAADQAYAATGLTAADINVFALHDACAFAELAQYEQVGIVPAG